MKISTKFFILNNLSPFQSLSQLEKNTIAETCQILDFKKNQYIYKEGVKSDAVYLLYSGSVFIGRHTSSNRPILKDILNEQSIFGENIFTKRVFRTDFAQAMSDCKVVLIEAKEFEKLVNSNTQFSSELTVTMISRLENLENRIKNFVFLKAKERIAAFLYKVAQKDGIKIGIDEILINLGLSHKDLASFTDTSRQTVARVLGNLKKSNVIHFSERKPGKILIRNLEALNY